MFRRFWNWLNQDNAAAELVRFRARLETNDSAELCAKILVQARTQYRLNGIEFKKSTAVLDAAADQIRILEARLNPGNMSEWLDRRDLYMRLLEEEWKVK
jgi:hypothetical protein